MSAAIIKERSIGWIIGWIALVDWLVYSIIVGLGMSPVIDSVRGFSGCLAEGSPFLGLRTLV